MASHRRPKQPSRARVTVLTAAAATAVALSAQASAHAAPAKPSLDEVKVQVDQIREEAEQATERFNGAKERGDQLVKQARELQDQIARGQQQIAEVAAGLSAVAGDQYRTGGVDPTVALMLSSDPDNYLDKASSNEQATATQAGTLKALQDRQHRLDQQKAEAAAILAELDATTQTLNQSKAEVQKKLQQATQLLNTLTAAQREAIDGTRASRDQNREEIGNLPPAAGYAAIAVRTALAQLGDDYVYGATGATNFDCSGLMLFSYRAAGVALPRTAAAQATVGHAVSLANAQPGDLVIYGADAHHVAMYIGNGKVVHAPHTGDVVKIASVTMMSIKTIRRV